MGASVQINCPGLHGTGAYIGSGLVVTAAHVVHPRGRSAFSASRIRVRLPNVTDLAVSVVWCHHRWESDEAATSDMALLRVAPTASLVFSRRMDVAARNLYAEVRAFREAPRDGHVTRVADPEGNDSFDSSDLSYHEGVSGAPIVDRDGNAIGIATRTATVPSSASFIGLPFIDENLGWLLDHEP